MKKVKVFEAFRGYGSQSISLRDCNIPHEVVGISEVEADAIIAYAAIRYDLEKCNIGDNLSDDEIKEHLKAKNVGWDFKKEKSSIDRMKKSKLRMLYKADILSDNFGDISLIEPLFLPDFDYFTYSFPCQDISIRGLKEGIEKGQTRSGLLYECERIIEFKRPKYLLMENVKNLLSKKFKSDFDDWCEYLENLGYKNFYEVLNAKDFGIAQNRERVFMVSILDTSKEDFSEEPSFEFPKGWNLDTKLKNYLEEDVDEKYFLKDKENYENPTRISFSENKDSCILGRLEGGRWDKSNFDYNRRVYNPETYAPSMAKCSGGDRVPKIPVDDEDE